jgi:lactate dehydrogenase-like 2-hydroxyacid dehydrogenase
VKIRFLDIPCKEAYQVLCEEFEVVDCDPDVIYTQLTKVTPDMTARLIVTPCTGLDHIDSKIPVLNLWDKEWLEWNVYATAEHTFALILFLAKRLGTHHMRSEVTRDAFTPMSIDLHGRTILIVGNGRVGRQVGRIAHGFGMHVTTIEEGELPSLALKKYKEADIVTIPVPLNEKTKGLIGKEQFDAMKPGTIFINTSRDLVVDETELRYNASRLYIGLDTAESYSYLTGLWITENSGIITPHVGGYSDKSRQATDMWIVDKLLIWRDRNVR